MRILALLLQPIIPQTANEVLGRLGVPAAERNSASLVFGLLPAAQRIRHDKAVLFKKTTNAPSPSPQQQKKRK